MGSLSPSRNAVASALSTASSQWLGLRWGPQRGEVWEPAEYRREQNTNHAGDGCKYATEGENERKENNKEKRSKKENKKEKPCLAMPINSHAKSSEARQGNLT